jgi:hypothetical protein
MMAFSPAQVEQLLRPVNPRRVQRDNHGMSHLAAYDVSAHLTRIFGFGGWRKEILSLELVESVAVPDPKRGDRLGWWVTYRCSMRLHVGDWQNDDGATGSAENLPSFGDAHDFALKNAISYALKRCAKDLGDQFGLSLYNKGSVKALIGRTLTDVPTPEAFAEYGPPDVDRDLPDLAPDWDEAPPGRADGLPTNRDGSLSRSRTTDEEKAAAGVMTAGQLAEHTALQPKRAEQTGVVTRTRAEAEEFKRQRQGGAADPWLDQPAGALPVPPEDQPGTIDPKDQRAIMAALGKLDREDRMARIIVLVNRTVASTNELSFQEGRRVRDRLKGAAT